jgi:quinol monooxygenase YgiN
VKPGKEPEFEAAWHELAAWSIREYGPEGWGKLFRDRDQPTHYMSVGQWPDEQAIAQWRASEGFQRELAKIREFVEDMHIGTSDLATEVG